MKFSEFASAVADIPRTITDEPQAGQPGQPLQGTVIPPGAGSNYDPNKPWRSLDVDSYVPVVEWVFKAGSKLVANHIVKEPMVAFDDEDMNALDTALTEATQRCLYDLKLSWADHPYAKLAAAVIGLGAVKYAAAKLLREAMEAEAKSRAQTPHSTPYGGRQNDEKPKATGQEPWQQEGRAGGPNPRPPTPGPQRQSAAQQYEPAPPPLHPQPSNARQSQPGTQLVSSMANGRMPASEAASFFAASQTPASPGFSVSEYDLPDE